MASSIPRAPKIKTRFFLEIFAVRLWVDMTAEYTSRKVVVTVDSTTISKADTPRLRLVKTTIGSGVPAYIEDTRPIAYIKELPIKYPAKLPQKLPLALLPRLV